ncbi:MAG: hypothetical protein Q8L48_09490 [Archangium sp.]|nr:hypothetical protein [Archangium sp.]
MTDSPKTAEQRHPPRQKPWTGVIVGVVLLVALLLSCLGLLGALFFITGA